VEELDITVNPYYEYDSNRHSVAEVRIYGEVYFEEHKFGKLRFIVRREPKEMFGKLAPHGTLDWQERQFGWWETDSHLSDWANTVAMFDASQKNLTILICLHRGENYWESTHVKTQVGSSSFAKEVLNKAQSK